MPTENESRKWERLPTDTNKSFEAFCVYRDMGAGRSLQKVADKIYGKSTANLRYVEEWSTNHNWQERVKAYDSHISAERTKRRERQKLQIEDNVLKDYKVMRKVIDIHLRELLLPSDSDKKTELGDFHDLLFLMKRADDYARRAVGLPNTITDNKLEHRIDETQLGKIDAFKDLFQMMRQREAEKKNASD